MTRRIGRLDSEASPLIVVRNRWAASEPRQQPHGRAGVGGVQRAGGDGCSPRRPQPSISKVVVSGLADAVRRGARTQASVAAQSAPGE